MNENYEIVGTMDYNLIMAAPIEVVAQFPQCTGLDPKPPGYGKTGPLAIDYIDTEPKLQCYKSLMKLAELRMSGDPKAKTPIANMMLSNATSVFQGLREYIYRGIYRRVDDTWMESYLRLLCEHHRARGFPAS